MQSFQTFLAQKQGNHDFEECLVIILDDGSSNYEDISSRIFERASYIFSSKHLTLFRSRSCLSDENIISFIQRICTKPCVKVFIVKPTQHGPKQLMLPLKHCNDCGGLFDGTNCTCCHRGDLALSFANVPTTHLPIEIPSFDANPSYYHETTFYATETIHEDSLAIELAVLVKGNASIRDAENVSVRVHSECLTGDVFYSKKCDCGEQKNKFMHMMRHEQHAVLLYIKGHEGRGNGLCNKVKAYHRREIGVSKTHVDALLELGCESDIRRYDAAFGFLKKKLGMKSIRLFSNNPEKIAAATNAFGPNHVISFSMPAGEYIYCNFTFIS